MTRRDLLAICRQYLGKSYYNYRKVVSQIQEYTDDIGLTYEQIAKVLEYWYVVKKADPKKSGGGIGILPHIYREALSYWERQEQFQKTYNKVQNYTKPEVEHMVAPSPYMSKPKTLKMFELK